MMNHLSQDQISRLILGKSSPEELQHSRECPQCAGDAARFQESVATFRESFQNWSQRERVPLREEVSTFLVRPRHAPGHPWAWVAAGIATVMLASLPLYKLEESRLRSSEGSKVNLFSSGPALAQSRTAEDVRLIEAVNRHLSHTLPGPMEPLMALISNSESNAFSGETQ